MHTKAETPPASEGEGMPALRRMIRFFAAASAWGAGVSPAHPGSRECFARRGRPT